MSEKARDGHGRWRSKTVAFRMSPEENHLLDDMVRLSGLTKQDFIVRRVLDKGVVVIPNPRVHKALREKMSQLCEQLRQLSDVSEMSPETIAILDFMGKIYENLCVQK